MNKKFKWLSALITSLALLLILGEFLARLVLGLGNPPLFEASIDYGYRFTPNQDIRRFGNHIFFNAQGLRSEPITFKPETGTVRILCVGDSITYGSVLLDQKKTYPYQLQDILNANSSLRFEVLNASAPGWSMQNEEAYLRKHGIYNSRIVVLQIGSHNLFQQKSNHDVVGRLPNYPDRKPAFALQEILFRYLPRYLPILKTKEVPEKKSALPEELLERSLTSLARIVDLIKDMDGQLAVVFIGPRSGLKSDNPLSNFGKKRLIQTVRELNLPFVDLERDFIQTGAERLFRDNVHPNEAGNMIIAQAAARLILNRFSDTGGD